MMLLLLLLLPLVDAFCPPGCVCVPEPDLSADCTGAGLSYIPHTLNPRIKKLILHGNELKRVMASELENYQFLEFLDLSRNGIFDVQESAFYKLSKLQVLKLSQNQIATLHADHFVHLKELKVLDLSHNGISRLPTSVFADLNRLELLNVSNNLIMDISPAAFTGLVSLKELSLASNALSTFMVETFRPLGQLRKLNLARNALVSIGPRSFARQRHLTDLNLRMNELESIDKNGFRGLKSLLRLNLDFNKLPSIPTLALAYLPALDYLSLRGNYFSTIPTSAFDGLSKLTQLVVTNVASLKSVQMNAFSGLFSLETLRLSDNPSLNSFSQFAFESQTHLRHLYINANNLSTLSPGSISLERMETFDIRHNPWLCDCEIIWLSAFASRTQVIPRTSALCYAPDSMVGRSLLDENIVQLACPAGLDDRRIIITIILVGGVLFLLTVITVVLFSLRRQLGGMARKYGFLPPASPNPSSHYSTYLDPKSIVDPKYYAPSLKSTKSLASKSGMSNCYYYTDDLWLQAEEQKSFLSSSGYYSNISLQRSPKSKDGTLFKVVSKYPVPITEL